LERNNDSVRLCGFLAGRPEWSHMGKETAYYKFPLSVRRLSGAVDTLNIVVSEDMLGSIEPDDSERIRVIGEIRSFNNKSGIGPKLVLTVLARSIEFTNDDFENQAHISGAICKAPNFRKTPMGREICDLMLAVNRRYGRSDYLPIIVWGTQAEEASTWNIGDKVDLWGRMQSRVYIKNEDGTAVEKTAFEISASEIVKKTDI
jgi:primosomal replication protein N